MLKGHVFSKQIFENPIFALWIDTLLDKKCGIGPYGQEMKVTRSGNTITVADGTVCIRGRFVEEDTSTQITAGTDNAYCILVIEIDLDKENTESELNQVSYKIVKGTSSYPNLTQTDIVKNNAGIYQYELARFRTGSGGITDFQDKRTFLDFNSIYKQIQTEYRAILDELQEELESVEDGSTYKLKGDFVEITLTSNQNGTIGPEPYPDNFSAMNTVLISAEEESGSASNRTYSTITSGNISLGGNAITGSGLKANTTYRIVLMKI